MDLRGGVDKSNRISNIPTATVRSCKAQMRDRPEAVETGTVEPVIESTITTEVTNLAPDSVVALYDYEAGEYKNAFALHRHHVADCATNFEVEFCFCSTLIASIICVHLSRG